MRKYNLTLVYSETSNVCGAPVVLVDVTPCSADAELVSALIVTSVIYQIGRQKL